MCICINEQTNVFYSHVQNFIFYYRNMQCASRFTSRALNIAHEQSLEEWQNTYMYIKHRILRSFCWMIFVLLRVNSDFCCLVSAVIILNFEVLPKPFHTHLKCKHIYIIYEVFGQDSRGSYAFLLLCSNVSPAALAGMFIVEFAVIAVSMLLAEGNMDHGHPVRKLCSIIQTTYSFSQSFFINRFNNIQRIVFLSFVTLLLTLFSARIASYGSLFHLMINIGGQ